MDRPAAPPPQTRDLVFCHGCEEEWYRDEHGLECPNCHSDFTEIIEANHDPREEPTHLPADPHPLADHNPWNAPDPGEVDIDRFRFQQNGPGEPLTGRYRINQTVTLDEQGRPHLEGQGGGGIMGLLGNALQGVIGPAVQQLLQQQHQQPQQQSHQQQRQDLPPLSRPPGPPTGASIGSPPSSAPGSPRRGIGPQQLLDQGTFVPSQSGGGSFSHHISGPGYTIHMTSSSNGPNLLHPRNAHGPQPFNPQPDRMEDMMRQMFMNIGAFPPLPGQEPGGQGGMPGQRMGPGGFMFDDDPTHPSGPPGFPNDFLRQMLGMVTGGAHGDVVYSQEALDRVVTQLMEQHQTGHAPGPASEAAIKSLPQRQLTEADFGHDGKADCSICMSEVELGDTVTALPCGHWFHGECIREWLKQTDTCPHCRQGIMPKEEGGVGANRAREPSQAPLHDLHHPDNLHSQMPGGFPNTGGAGQSGNSGASSTGMFGRMRDAFGGGSGSGTGGARTGAGGGSNNNDNSGHRS